MFEDLYGDVPDLFPRRYSRPQDGTPRPKVPALDPQEEESLLSKAAGMGLGGLGYVGSVLEKALGGRAIRAGIGLASGMDVDPSELLSWVPFSDATGLTDVKNRVGGREILRHAGLADQEDTWGNFFGGLGLDVATDPLTYMTFGTGALTQGGKVAQRAGILPETVGGRVGTTLNDLMTTNQMSQLGKVAAQNQRVGDVLASTGKTLAEVADQPLGYSVGFGLPFRSPSFGVGQAGLDALAGVKGGLGTLDAGLRSVPLLGHQYGFLADTAGKAGDAAYRYGRSLLDSRVKGATSHEGIGAALDATAHEMPVIADFRRRLMGYADELAQHNLDPDGSVLRQVAEGTWDRTLASPHPVIDSVATRLKGDLNEMLTRLQGLGVNVQELADLHAEYLPRYMTPLARPTGGFLGRPRQALATADPRLAGREEILSGVRGGTEAINRLVADPDVALAATPLAAADAVRAKYLFTPQEIQRLHALNQLGQRAATPAELAELATLSQVANPTAAQARRLSALQNLPTEAQAAERAALRATHEQADRLADWARSLDPQYAASGNPNLVGVSGTQGPLRFFGNHPLADAQTYFDRAARVLGGAEATQNLLARSATTGTPVSASGVTMGSYVSAREALRRAGLVGPGAALPGGEAELLRRFNALRAGQGGPGMQAASALDLLVPEQVANEATRYLGGFRSPEAVGAIGSVLDAITGWTKAGQTAMWPAFHTRNFLSGMWQNWVKGAGEAPGGLVKSVQDAYALARGQVVNDANLVAEYARRGLTPEQATRELAREMYAYGVGGHLPHLTREAIGPGGSLVDTGADLAAFRGQAMGTIPTPSVLESAGQYLPRSWEQANPLNVAGMSTNKDIFAPVAAGRQWGDLVENVNRGSLYLSLRRQGYTAEQAAKEVLAAHFDYTRAAKTDFEKTVLSRLIPFYTFSRNNIPYQVEQLLTNPGGPAGQLARAAFGARQDAGFLPAHMGGGLAIPTGMEDDSGTRRYLTRLDLPPDQAFELLRGGPNWLPQSLMGLLGQTNPLLKGPAEYATGKQFFTGRDTGDLYAMTGSVLADQMLANSPLSRAATTLRTLADERKWQDLDSLLAVPLNLGTGVRVTDVDMERARDVAAREMIKEALRGNEAISKFESFSPKPGSLPYLTPEEWDALRLSRTLEQKAQRRAKERR